MFLDNITIIVRLTQVYANNIVLTLIVLTLKVRLCLYKTPINYLSYTFLLLFFYLYKIIFYFFCFPIDNNVYPKYCQLYKKDVSQLTQETLSLKTNINELDLLKTKVIIQCNICKQEICCCLNSKNT